MTHLNKKPTKNFTFFLIITILLSIFLSLFCPFPTYAKTSKAASSPCFVIKYHTLFVNQKIQYQIKHLKNEYSVSYTISNSSLAHITKKTGILTPKKAGNIMVKAIIYTKKHKKIKTLTNRVTITTKKNILPNAVFKLKKSINPYNFTISLSCNRILLKKEIQSDTLTILPKGKNAPILNAAFSKLSKDGKEVTYTLNSSSQKKLCPGNFSMDGNYTLESTCFSKKLALTYEERLPQNTLSGFVFHTDGNPVKNALISLKKGTVTTKKCYTNQNGHYKLRSVFEGDFLTVEKDGYQTTVLQNPTISEKGTTCENIILRSLSESSVNLKFLVTDINNNPLPDASIQIFEDKKIHESTHFESTDSFNKNNLLFSDKTDASGTLLLSNRTNLSSASCSNLTIQENAVLSYTASSNLSSANTKILPSSVLNTVDNYTIYVNKFSMENPSSAYATQKIQFSFCNLITNQAFLHIKLRKCDNTQIKNLTLNYENPLSHCHAITLYFYHPEHQSSFYQYTVDNRFFQIENNKITISSYLPITLPDNTYFLSVNALTEDGMILAKSSVLPVTIQNSCLSSGTISLYRPRYARALIYGDFTEHFPYKVSFQLYQKYENNYFFIDTFSTTPFTKNVNDFITADLLFSNLLPYQNYFLLPASEDISSKELLSFSATFQNTFLSKENANYSNTPLLQIHCIATNHANSDFLEDFSSNSIKIKYHTSHTISKDFIRSSQNYPNSVIAVYLKNGKLLTTTLTIPPADNQKVIQTTTSNIIDIYTNKEILITNQDS